MERSRPAERHAKRAQRGCAKRGNLGARRRSPIMTSISETLVDQPATLDEANEVSERRAARLDRGEELDRYVVLEVLGAGGMGVVYAAYDPLLDRKVAIKVLQNDYAERRSTEGRARLLREAKALAQLSHPNVVTVHEVGIVGSRVYLVMEHVQGQTLGEWLKAGTRSSEEVMRMFVAAGQGLLAAHDKGLVHRDFKPDNVMVDEGGRVRVMDFGLARSGTADDDDREHDDDGLAVERSQVRERSSGEDESADGDDIEAVDDEESADGEVSGRVDSAATRTLPEGIDPALASALSDEMSAPLTRRSTVLGTPAYMAPEQWLGLPVDARTDQYSFCVTLYEALYGARPFAGTRPAQLMVAVLDEDIDPPPAGSRVPAWLRAVLLRGMSRQPEARWPDLRGLLDALAADPTRRRRHWVMGLGLGAVALSAVAVQRGSQAHRESECEQAAAAIEETWHDEVRAQLGTAVQAGGPLGAPAWERVEPRLDEYAQAWSAARQGLCMSPPQERADGELLAERSEQCLDGRREALGEFIRRVQAEGADTVERVVQVAAELPRLAPCTDLPWLRRWPVEPSDPAVQQQIAELRRDLVSIATRTALAPGTETSEAVGALVERAEQLDWAPLVARSKFAHGHALSAEGTAEPAAGILTEAYLLATELDDVDLALEVASRLTYVEGALRHDADRAELWARLCEAIHGRLEISATDLRTADLLSTQAHVAFARGDMEAAIDVHEREIEIRESLLGADHPSLIDPLSGLSNALSGLGEGGRALQVLERVLALEETTLGSDHPLVAWTLMDLALAQGVEQRYDTAHELAARALELRRRIYGPGHPMVAQSLDFMCAADADRGRLDRAAEECAQALEIRERELGPEHPDTGWTHFNLGLVAQGRGDIDRAKAQFARSLEITAAALGSEHPRTMAVRGVLAAVDQPDGHGGGGDGHGGHGHAGGEEHGAAAHDERDDGAPGHTVDGLRAADHEPAGHRGAQPDPGGH